MVEVEALEVVHPGHREAALVDVSFQHGKGALTILGPTGSGKSTLLATLATHVRPAAGSVRVEGRDVLTDPLGVRAVIGYVPQVLGLPGDLTLREYLEELARLDGFGSEASDRSEAAMVAVNLQAAADRRLKAFSGGMRRRALLAQALLRDPQVLLVDGPTAGLDPLEQITVLELLRAVADTRTVLVAAQLVSEALAVPGRVMILEGGRVAGLTRAEHLAELADGHVFELPWSFKHRVVGMTVATGDRERILVIGDSRPHLVAREVPPTPEHGYLYLVWRSRQGWTT
ncbi:MAG: ABC transporter ATP-binding protein [Clostridia bacterium]